MKQLSSRWEARHLSVDVLFSFRFFFCVGALFFVFFCPMQNFL